MAKRDPDKTVRDRIIERIKDELRRILPQVLAKTGRDSEARPNKKRTWNGKAQTQGAGK